MKNHGLFRSPLILLAVLSSAGLCAAQAPNKPAAPLPDWSGTWSPLRSNFAGGSGGPSGQGEMRGGRPSNPFSLTPEYQALYDKLKSEGAAPEDGTDCEPPGMPVLLMIPAYPLELLISPQKVVVMHEYMNQNRRIFTDGRKHPPLDELEDSFNGHSIGHWEGDTLVVDTVGFKTRNLFDTFSKHSDSLQVVERIRRVGADKLEIQVTLTDPKAFTKPWSSTFGWERKTGEGWDLKEYECAENNRKL